MSNEDIAKWALENLLVNVSETAEKWGLTPTVAGHVLESLATASPNTFEGIYVLSGQNSGKERVFDLIPEGEIVSGAGGLRNAEVQLFGLRVLGKKNKTVHQVCMTNILGKIETAETKDRLYIAPGFPLENLYRRTVYDHRRGPSPDGSKRTSVRSSFSRTSIESGEAAKRKLSTPKEPVKKPKIDRKSMGRKKKDDSICKTLDSFFK